MYFFTKKKTLTEKIEDLNEEIHKLKNTINTNVQILAHTQEKYEYVKIEAEDKEKDLNIIKEKVKVKKEALKNKQATHEKKSLKNYNEKKRIDDINSKSLISYYKKSYKNIKTINDKIQEAAFELSRLRPANKQTDIKILLDHTKKLMSDHSKLIAFEDHERINN